MKKGDIVLITFPFTDLSGSKLRPALILAESTSEITVVFITTQLKWLTVDDALISPTPKNGIKKQSLIRISKIATLDKILVRGRLGVIDSMTATDVEKKLKAYLQIA